MLRRNHARRRALAALALAALCLLSLARGAHDQRALAARVVRLHVLASSDSEADQALKYTVRDAVLAEAEALLDGVSSRREAEEALAGAVGDLAGCARDAVVRAGCRYPVTVRLETAYYPTRRYEDFSLPAGYYRSLRVEIGAAEGRNWWCVVFPPLCTAGVVETEAVSLPLEEEQISLITGGGTEYELRFQCAEWWGELLAWLRDRGETAAGDGSPASAG